MSDEQKCGCPCRKVLKDAAEDARGHRSESVYYAELEARIAELPPCPCASERDEWNNLLPTTFYAGLPFEQRVILMVDQWNRAIKVNQELEAERDRMGKTYIDPKTMQHLVYQRDEAIRTRNLAQEASTRALEGYLNSANTKRQR